MNHTPETTNVPDESRVTRRSRRRGLVAAVAGLGLAFTAALPASTALGAPSNDPLDEVPKPVIDEMRAMLENIDDDRGLAVMGVMLPAAAGVVGSEPGLGTGSEPWRLIAWVWADEPAAAPAGWSHPCTMRAGSIARCA
jgi:hypothetical protein